MHTYTWMFNPLMATNAYMFVCRYVHTNICIRTYDEKLSPVDPTSDCLCHMINNKKHVYRQSQVRKPRGSEVKWAECSFIIGTGYRVFNFTLDSLVDLWGDIQSADDLVSQTSMVRILHLALQTPWSYYRLALSNWTIDNYDSLKQWTYCEFI